MYIYRHMQITFILVEPAVPGNIGAAARAMKTMGFSGMRLVNPCDHLSEQARILAHASQEILESAGVYASLEAAREGLDLAVATTAGKRRTRVEYAPASELPSKLLAKGGAVGTAGIVFGREESGLTNAEIRMCDLVTTVPLARPYPSLNLAQAVMIYAYTLSGFAHKKNTGSTASPAEGREGFSDMMDKAKRVLREMGLGSNPALYGRLLERLAQISGEDIHLLHSVLNRLLSGKN